MSVVGDIVCSELGHGTTGCSGECCFGVMYCEWYGVCDFVVLSVVRYMLTMVVLLYVVCFLRLGVVCCVVM